MRRTPLTTHAPASPGRARGFTLVEMLVVVGITVLMFGIIGVVYRNVVGLISTGTSTSRVLNNGGAAGEQIARDADKMLGPSINNGGFLVIINQRVIEDDDLMNNPGVPVTQEDLDNGTRRPVRSDQLLFIRNRGDLEPIAPGNTTFFSGSSQEQFVKVWYGHLRRTASNGLDLADDGYTVRRLGLPDMGTGAPEPGTNQLASQWVLGRQAMFLGHSNTGNPIHVDTDTDGAGPGGAWPDWLIETYSNRPWFSAGSDVIDKTLNDITGSGDFGNADSLSPTPTPLPDAAYRRRALHYAYPVPAPGGPGTAQMRLRVNPSPNMDTNDSGDVDSGDDPLSTLQIAQTHPYMAGNVSDFVVEFAADAQPKDGDIDVNPSTGEIIWYDAFDANGNVDMPTWGGGANPNYPYYSHGPGYPLGPAAAFVFRHDDVGPNSNWPYLIRIRYRVGDDQGEVGRTLGGQEDKRDNDGDGTVDNENAGEYSTFEPGRWFERIIRVPRPASP